MAINKITAGILYSYGYKLQDSEGNVWNIIALRSAGRMVISKNSMKNRSMLTADFEEIGTTYKILARDLEQLTQEIEHDGKKLLPKDEFWVMYGGGVAESAKEYWLKDFIDNILYTPIKKLSAEMVEQLAQWHFNIGFPEGTTTNLKD